MSATQTESSLITIANLKLGKSWKSYTSNEAIDNHVLKVVLLYAEAKTLFSIVEEMMRN